MNSFLKMVRYKNLLMIVLLQVLINWCLVVPILNLYELTPTFTILDFIFMTLATIMIAGGGYVINDYFDTKADLINRPNNVIVGTDISRGNALTWHLALNIIACILGALVSIRIGVWIFAFAYPIISGLLWFYSSTYKKMFLLGNIIVAFLISIIPLMPVAYQLPGQMNTDNPNIINGVFDLNLIFYWSLGFSIFSFITTLFREIIKDMEDYNGDKESGRNTIPVVLGFKVSKIIVISLMVITILGIIWVWINFLNDLISATYLSVLVILPLLLLIYKTLKIKTKEDCHFVSSLSKIIMLLGILYLFVVRYNLYLVGNE